MRTFKHSALIGKCSWSVVLVGIFLLISAPTSWAQSFGAAPPKSKKTEKKQILDPSLTQYEGALSFDDETKKALALSKTPGVIEAAQEQAGTIFRIEIIGATKTEPDAVILQLSSKIGRPYSSVLVAEDINEIYKMGLFSDVAVFEHVLPSKAVVLRYRLTEIPTIFQVKIEGNDTFSDDEIKESIIGLENYHVAKSSRLRESVEKIREFYVSKGYFLANVSYELRPTNHADIKKRESEGLSEKIGSSSLEIDTANVLAPDFVDVVFRIQENNKVRINRISFIGNQRLDDDVLKAHLRSQENHLLSILSDWGTFRRDFLEIDTLILEKVYNDHGFLKAKILEPQVRLSGDKSFIDIAFKIIENDQYRLGAVTVSGDLVERSEVAYRLSKEAKPDETIFLASKLGALVEQEEGDVFNKSLMGQNILAIAEKYYDAGYAYANVSPVPIFHDDEKIVDIAIEIESGPKVRIERIDIEGNEKTKDEVIRRELVIFEAEYYSSSLVKLSEYNVNRLGYFESVEITNKPGSASDKMILTIKVKEKNTGNIQAGAGYGTGGEGLILRGQVYNQNLFGRGQSLSLSVNVSNFRRMFDVSFVEPYLGYVFDNPLSFAITGYNRDVYLGEFNRKSFGGDLTFGYPLGGPFAHLSRKWKRKVDSNFAPYVFDFEQLSLLLTYTAERVEISDLAASIRAYDLYQGMPRYTTSLKPTIRLDQRDNRLFPTRGLYAEFRTEFASRYLGASGLSNFENSLRSRQKKQTLDSGLRYATPPAEGNNFIRYGTNFRLYHNLDDWFFLKGLVFKTNFELGLLNTLGKPLIFENFALGGANAVRGYSYRSISPTARVGALFPYDPRQYLRIGGDKQFFSSFELEFPIIKALGLSGVFFFDMGNAYSHEDNLFYIGGKSKEAASIHPADPLGIYEALGLLSSTGFGVRWNSPLGYLRFEWGFPLNPRPASTPGLSEKDPPVQFEFNMGPSF